MNELLSLAHALSKFVVGTEGNVSKKIDSKTFLIKSSGTKLASLSQDDITNCDYSNKQINQKEKKPSMEVFFHSWLLSFSEINFVAHTHPTNTLKILCSGDIKKFAQVRMFPDQVVFNGKTSCVIDYAHPGSALGDKIKSGVSSFIDKNGYFPKVILLQNHGIICPGKTSAECLAATEICEKSAIIFPTKGLKFLSWGEVEELSKDPNEIYRKNIIS